MLQPSSSSDPSDLPLHLDTTLSPTLGLPNPLQPPTDTPFDRTAFTFLPHLLEILNKMQLSNGTPEEAADIANLVASLKQSLTSAQKYLHTLPGTNAPTSKLEATLAHERAVLERKKETLKKFSELPIFQKLAPLLSPQAASEGTVVGSTGTETVMEGTSASAQTPMDTS
ncbi:hypothetical protein HDV00_009883 [Rhizophlyctis rosea]|nr:hypothetical protein HDV00_009883 [Rhizophlyctis rosea]